MPQRKCDQDKTGIALSWRDEPRSQWDPGQKSVIPIDQHTDNCTGLIILSSDLIIVSSNISSNINDYFLISVLEDIWGATHGPPLI
jgi:hypothetical protein